MPSLSPSHRCTDSSENERLDVTTGGATYQIKDRRVRPTRYRRLLVYWYGEVVRA